MLLPGGIIQNIAILIQDLAWSGSGIETKLTVSASGLQSPLNLNYYATLRKVHSLIM